MTDLSSLPDAELFARYDANRAELRAIEIEIEQRRRDWMLKSRLWGASVLMFRDHVERSVA